VTMTAGGEKIFSAMPNVGFLAHAAQLAAEAAAPEITSQRGAEIARLIWNDRIDAAMTAFFIAVVVIILSDSLRVWSKLMLRYPEGSIDEEAA
jgi:carbon starvation protein